jgi:hypothetical protein
MPAKLAGVSGVSMFVLADPLPKDPENKGSGQADSQIRQLRSQADRPP